MIRMILTSVLMLGTMGTAFLLPKPEYSSLDILSELEIPYSFAGWRSRDVSEQLNLKDDRYNFINDVFARLYQNRQGEQLLFLILDAGNFHNPKVCYTSSGFAVTDLGKSDFESQGGRFEATALDMQRQDGKIILFYWLNIDKKIVSWTGQKVTEFWASLSNRKKSGLMVRIEIPSRSMSAEEGLDLGRRFIADLSQHLDQEQREYLFGEQVTQVAKNSPN